MFEEKHLDSDGGTTRIEASLRKGTNILEDAPSNVIQECGLLMHSFTRTMMMVEDR